MQPRVQTRIPVGYPADITSDTSTGEGVLLDLSPSGCRMQSDVPLTPGAYLALKINLAHESNPLAVEVSIVRWAKNGHCGVEFLRYSHGDRERVTDLLSSVPPLRPYSPVNTASC